MNAAARLVHQSGLSHHLVRIWFFSRRQLTVILLALALLLSALGIVYVTQMTRMLHASFQSNLAEKNRLTVERGQLLLERSTWIMQARIQAVAETKLGMQIPDRKSVVVINESRD